jgi:hypothetical protein
MLTLNMTPKTFSPDDAEAKAAELNASDPDWTYRAIHDPKGTGYSLIGVYDEEGEFIAKV